MFSDLDGTLLDAETYDYGVSLPAVKALEKHGVPLILCSAKTRSEIKFYQHVFGINHPFIVENGGATVIPRNYFAFPIEDGRESEGYVDIEHGERIEMIRWKIEGALRDSRVRYKLFTQMTAEEISEDSGLPLHEADLTRRREYSETVKLEGDQVELQRAIRSIDSAGLTYVFGGRYLTISAGNSKGTGVRRLRQLYARAFRNVTTYAFGDEENDLSMFQEVDKAILVQKPNGSWASMNPSNLVKVHGIGPNGFRKGVENELGVAVGDG
ncbi:MAG: HAD-IIB family hydrolase [Thaumarchaeota archaeon]|nr:HAD-IIB family hydrolase [Nitrososphaerota archaeon]